jgi:RF-1 domain
MIQRLSMIVTRHGYCLSSIYIQPSYSQRRYSGYKVDDDGDEDDNQIGSYVEGRGVRIGFVERPVRRDRIALSFARSSGPGGQHVNKVNTKADARFNVNEADWLSADVRKRIVAMHASRINAAGELVVTSSRHRSQHRNVEDAFYKIGQLIDDACFVPQKRIATKVPQRVVEDRLKRKKRRSDTKRGRQKLRSLDDY